MATFGERLRQLRKQANKTQKELASKFKISESAIGMYERNERAPSQDLTKEMADFFKVSIDYLLGHSDHQNAEELAAKWREVTTLTEQGTHVYEQVEEIMRGLNKDAYPKLSERQKKLLELIQELTPNQQDLLLKTWEVILKK